MILLKVFSGSWWVTTTLGSFCLLSGILGSLVLIRLNPPQRIILAFLLLVEFSWSGLRLCLLLQRKQQHSRDRRTTSRNVTSVPAAITPIR